MIFGCKDISKSFGEKAVLRNITFSIEENEKAAIIGVNGAGKTTLFKIICRLLSQDSGELFLKKDASIGYMEQNAQLLSDKTVYEELSSVFDNIKELELKLEKLTEEMSSLKDDSLVAKINEYDNLNSLYEKLEGYSYKSRLKGVLKGLGFSEAYYNMPISSLSGGQKTRIYLGKLLLKRPDLLLLDEPTNHLDIDSVLWLEDYLKSYEKAVLLISHDRFFIDKISTKIIEIENGKSTAFNGNYSYYSSKKAELRSIAYKSYVKNQEEIKRQEEVIRTLRSFNREKSIKRAESRQKALDKMEIVERPNSLPNEMRLVLNPSIESGNDVMSVIDLTMGYGEKLLYKDIAFSVKKGNKIAILGPNGIGKTTLLKNIMGEIKPSSGKINLGTNVFTAYYDQELKFTDLNKTIFEEISDTYPTLTNEKIRTTLAAFVFMGDDVFKKIGSLSGGEQGRLSLAKIMLSKANLLILDEPTNHLDIQSKEILENAISSYTGTVIYVSHDRYFIDKTANIIFELSYNGLRVYNGNYSYYISKRINTTPIDNTQKDLNTKPSDLKAERIAKKEQQAKKRRIKNQIDSIEGEIDSIEMEILRLDKSLESPEISCDSKKANEVYTKKSDLEERLMELMEKWEEIQGLSATID